MVQAIVHFCFLGRQETKSIENGDAELKEKAECQHKEARSSPITIPNSLFDSEQDECDTADNTKQEDHKLEGILGSREKMPSGGSLDLRTASDLSIDTADTCNLQDDDSQHESLVTALEEECDYDCDSIDEDEEWRLLLLEDYYDINSSGSFPRPSAHADDDSMSSLEPVESINTVCDKLNRVRDEPKLIKTSPSNRDTMLDHKPIAMTSISVTAQ